LGEAVRKKHQRGRKKGDPAPIKFGKSRRGRGTGNRRGGLNGGRGWRRRNKIFSQTRASDRVELNTLGSLEGGVVGGGPVGKGGGGGVLKAKRLNQEST